MSLTLSRPAFAPREAADTALKLAAGFWFVVLVVGQVIFAVSTAMFYGLTALRGDTQAWNKHLAHGFVPGDTIGNTALIAHIVMAVMIILSGAIQFMPQIRRRAPTFHRWNGRIYILTAFGVSLAGLYLLLVRGGIGIGGNPTGLTGEIGTAILAALIMICAAQALRYAMKRQIPTHRRWAFRLFVVVSAALFVRAGAILWVMIATGTGSLDVSSLTGPIRFLVFAQYIVPLCGLELYFWTQRRGGTSARMAMAAALVAMTLLLGAGIAGASAALFVPSIRASLDSRPSIATALATTIKTNGIDAAIQQYRRLHAARPVIYNFDEDELNLLGYDLMRARHYQDAIRILALNTESYPKSGNTWDSLGEAYMDNGEKAAAVTNYNKSLALNPANHNAVIMLHKLSAM